jgi:glycosyltransferase involved in cell wall biosynthesis
MPITYLGRGRFDPRTLPDLIRIIRDQRIDVLHCHGYGSTTFGRLAGALTQTPVLVHEHMIDGGIPAYLGVMDRVLAPLATRGVAVSEAVADFMVRRRHLDPGRIEVVRNGAPDEFFCRVSPGEQAETRTRLGLDADGLYVGIVGRLHPIKGHDVFLDAVAGITATHPKARFLVVGDGELSTPLRLQAHELGINDVVDFMGYQPDLLAYLQAFDVLVIASRSEGAPLVVLEGMAGGKAMVATRVGGIPEILTHGEHALLVPSEDPEAMGRAIVRLLDDPDLREGLGRAAEDLCDREYRVRHTVARLETLYREVLR